MPSPTPTPSTPKMGTTKYSVSRGGMQGKPLALPGEKLYNIVHAVRPGAVVQVDWSPVQAFGAPTSQKLPHFLFFTLIIADAPKIASTKTPCQGPFSDSDAFFSVRSRPSARSDRPFLPPEEKCLPRLVSPARADQGVPVHPRRKDAAARGLTQFRVPRYNKHKMASGVCLFQRGSTRARRQKAGGTFDSDRNDG